MDFSFLSHLVHFLGAAVGSALGTIAVLPFVKRHLLNLHKRVGHLEAQLGVEPTTPAPSLEPSLVDFLPQRRRP